MRIAPTQDTSTPATGRAARVVVVPLQAINDLVTESRGGGPRAALAALIAGKTIEATVRMALPNGRTVLEVDAEQIDLPLSEAIAPGTQLRLRATSLGALTAMAEAMVIEPDTTELTPAARLLTQLATHAASEGPEPLTVSVVGLKAGPASLAASLADAFEHSGLFYESHLEAWVEGKRDLSSIAREPQASLGSRSELRFIAGSMAGAFEAAASESTRASIPAEAVNAVQNQLQALETGAAICRAEVWPQQFAHLSVGSDDRHATGGAVSRSWRAHLRLELPQLGVVDAMLTLTDGGIGIRMSVGHAGTQAKLRGASLELARSLADAGLRPLSVDVACDAY